MFVGVGVIVGVSVGASVGNGVGVGGGVDVCVGSGVLVALTIWGVTTAVDAGDGVASAAEQAARLQTITIKKTVTNFCIDGL